MIAKVKPSAGRMHYSDGGGMPVCRRLWLHHTKNEPRVTTDREAVRCLACRNRMNAARLEAGKGRA